MSQINSAPEGKYNLELNIVGDGRIFLNFWNWYNGFDVCAEYKDGKLEIEITDDHMKEVDLKEFMGHVIDSIKTIKP